MLPDRYARLRNLNFNIDLGAKHLRSLFLPHGAIDLDAMRLRKMSDSIDIVGWGLK